MQHRRWQFLFLAVWTLFAPSVFAQENRSEWTQKAASDSALNVVQRPTLNAMRSTFPNPGVDYATAPLWTWNDLLTEEQIRSTLQDLAGQSVLQAFVHPRPGLMTPYLSEDWFHLWRVALDEAEKLGMKIWIYDENSYPSGFAGGWVPEKMPESRGQGLEVLCVTTLGNAEGAWAFGEEIRYVVQENADGLSIDRTDEVRAAMRAGKAVPELSAGGVRWVLGRQVLAQPSQWFGGKWYVDLLKPGVTRCFLETTYEVYKRELGEHFGKRIPGIFTDEPNLVPTSALPWTDDLPQQFLQRRGYNLIPLLASLSERHGDWKRVRRDYRQTLHELFVERWAQPCFAFCEANGLEFTGHYFEHDWPGATHSMDSMAMYVWHQRPAIDMLMNHIGPTHGQFGNARSGRELSSVAHQCGRARTLSENYGAGGYDIRLEDLRRLGDWSYAMGVNTMDEHLSYITIRGARKHDHPQTFSYHSPWFTEYRGLAEYWMRLSYLLSQGELSRERFLLLEPTTTAWMYQEDPQVLDALRVDSMATLNTLEAQQIDYDLGSEDVLARMGSVSEQGVFTVGHADYDGVVLPKWMENVNRATLQLLDKWVEKQGTLWTLSEKPIERVDGIMASELDAETAKQLARVNQAAQNVSTEEWVATHRKSANIAVLPETAPADTFHLLRSIPEGEVLFLCNTNMEETATGRWVCNRNYTSVELWNPETGTTEPYTDETYTIPPCASRVWVFHCGISLAESMQKGTSQEERIREILFPEKGMTVQPLDQNVLPLDYMDIATKGEKRLEQYFYKANDWLWKQNSFEKSPWDNGVQFQDERLRHTFSDDSGFVVTYRFTVDRAAGNDFQLVVEHPTVYRVTVNGVEVSRLEDAWKFDRSFGVFGIASAVRDGENVVELTAAHMDMFCEVMPVFLVGNFLLQPAEKGFLVQNRPFTLDRKNLPEGFEGVAGWSALGAPFYGGAVDYTITYEAPASSSERTVVRLPAIRHGWNGAVAAVLVQGKRAGTIYLRDSVVDVTEFLQPGQNTVTVRVYGTPKNTFGPHHQGAIRGSAWPGIFHQAPETTPPGTQYDVIPYGIF